MVKKSVGSPRRKRKLIKAETYGGVLLLGATVLALIWANSPLGHIYDSIFHYEIGIASSHFTLQESVLHWINDGLMAIFFFMIGLEIKREMLIGHLNTVKKASFPVFAALGGMIVPVSIYLIFNNDPETVRGWGIPAATDIAFSLAILQLLGKRVPIALKVFLATFAVADDLGAVIVIAAFYSVGIKWAMLVGAFAIMAVLMILSRKGIYSRLLYFSASLVVWYFFLKSGIHPTVAGVLLAFTIPISKKMDVKTYVLKITGIIKDFRASDEEDKKPVLTKMQLKKIDEIKSCTHKVSSPLQQLEYGLHDWVNYLIIPLFALANAGVKLRTGGSIDITLALIIMISLFAGKTIGITMFSYIGSWLGIATIPKDIDLQHLIGVACLGGVGFTMSIFIANLAFFGYPEILNSAKMGIIMGSLISGVTGYTLLKMMSPKPLAEV
ncbi:MAG: Na+/H+ antiporter NhaA [Bacteroidales bacterium]|nr:Na+/H+ antiporter NhaA [Bacteroidales bacterium]